MSVTPEAVRRTLALARLRVEEEDVGGLVRDLGGILAHVEKLASLDAETQGPGVDGGGVGPGDGSRFSGEEAEPLPDSEVEPDALGEGGPEGLAPDWRDGFFLVPRLPGLDGP